MSCQDIPGSGQVCRTIQVLEPDPTVPVANWRFDPALDESGEVILTQGQTSITVNFKVKKTSANYRFEYLYVDAFGIANPGDIEPVVVSQTVIGFTVQFAGSPLAAGYILRWRVVVVYTEVVPGLVDTPESLYLALPLSNLFTASFVNPRSNVDYGFSELRIENLTDDPTDQTPVLPQVVQKTILGFTVALNPTPPTGNYFLVVRSP